MEKAVMGLGRRRGGKGSRIDRGRMGTSGSDGAGGALSSLASHGLRASVSIRANARGQALAA